MLSLYFYYFRPSPHIFLTDGDPPHFFFTNLTRPFIFDMLGRGWSPYFFQVTDNHEVQVTCTAVSDCSDSDNADSDYESDYNEQSRTVDCCKSMAWSDSTYMNKFILLNLFDCLIKL